MNVHCILTATTYVTIQWSHCKKDMLLLHLLNEYLARFSAVTLIVETKQYQQTTSNGL